MQKLIWQNSNGDEINLTSGNYGITEWEGFSNASLNIQSQQVPFQDGGVFLDTLIEQRELSVTLKMQDNGNLEERYRMRRELIHALNPKLGEGYLIYTNDFTSKRIKCVPQIPLFPTHNSNDSGTPSASLAWTACEPYWEDLEETQIPLIKGNNTTVINGGDVETEMKIESLEQGVNLYVQNQTTEKKVEIIKNINGVIEINTNRGQKSVTEREYGSEINEVGMSKCILNKNSGKLIIIGSVVCSINNYDKLNIESSGFEVSNIKLINNKYFAFYYNTIAPSNNDKIHYSENSENWSEILGSDIAFGNNKYFVPKVLNEGHGGALYNENMQLIGEVAISGSENDYGKAIFANGIFLIMQKYHSEHWYEGQGGEYEVDSYDVATSSDGQNWTVQNPITTLAEEYTLYYIVDIIYFNNKIVAVDADGKFLSTSTGDSWEISEIITYAPIEKVIVINDKIYILCNNGLWAGTTLSNIEKISEKKLLSLTIRNNVFYGIDYDYNIIKSEDLETWSIVKRCFYTNTLESGIKTDKGLFFTSGKKILKKINNMVSVLNPTDENVRDITECNNELIVGTSSSYILRSSNYNDFEKISVSRTDLKKIVYGKGVYVAIYNGESDWILYYSTDLETWHGINGTRTVKDCVFDKYRNIFIAVTDDKILTSQDGITFNEKVSQSRYFKSIAISKNQIIIGGKNYYASSFDGETFNIIKTDEDDKIYDKAVYGNGIFLIIGNTYLRMIKEGQYKVSYLINTKIADDVVLSYYSEEEKCFIMYTKSLTIFNLVFTESENIISKLSTSSDMSLSLKIGNNEIYINNESGDLNASISYRQKYIGV